MKIISLICLAGLSFLLNGCHTYDVASAKPVRYAKEVQVIPLDTAKRAITPSVQIFESAADVQRPCHKIALLSRPGHRGDEGLIVNALAWRARQLGADGLVLLPAGRGWPDFHSRLHLQGLAQ